MLRILKQIDGFHLTTLQWTIKITFLDFFLRKEALKASSPPPYSRVKFLKSKVL